MKLTALAVTALFISAPALAQGYGAPDASSNSSAAMPAAPQSQSPSANGTSDDTRVASNQAKHRQHKKSSAGTQNQMSTSPSQPASPDANSTPSAPVPQQ